MKWLKIFGVVIGAASITALGIDAADTLSGSRSTLLGQLITSDVLEICKEGMVHLPSASTFTCVDRYEASASEDCEYLSPQNEIETKANIDDSSCASISKEAVEPWRFITREQAVMVCSRAGKRLPKSDEWYMAAVGTPDDASKCNIDTSSVLKSGTNQGCVSASGIVDAVGNGHLMMSLKESIKDVHFLKKAT
jgi:hypothetical protein